MSEDARALLEKVAAQMTAEAERLLIEKGWPNRRVALIVNADGTLEAIDIDEEPAALSPSREDGK